MQYVLKIISFLYAYAIIGAEAASHLCNITNTLLRSQILFSKYLKFSSSPVFSMQAESIREDFIFSL